MKILLLGILLLNMNTLFAADTKTEKFPAYGGILTFQGQDDHSYSEFHSRSFWISCLDKLEICQEFMSVMKSSDGEIFLGRQISRDEIPQILKNINEDISYTYGMKTEILTLTSKGIYSKKPSYIYYPFVAISAIGDILKLPYSIPAGIIKESTLHSQIEDQLNHLFKKEKLNQVKHVNLFEGRLKSVLNVINLELSKSYEREL